MSAGWEIQHKNRFKPEMGNDVAEVHSPPQGEANHNEFIMFAKNHGV
jgi:hypothetical protein